MRRSAGVLFALAVLASGTGCGSVSLTSGGAVAVDETSRAPVQGALPRSFVSPAGEVIVEGTVDELGWTLPLDIERPRPPRPAAELLPQPRFDASSLPSGATPEVRLGADDSHTQNETAIAIDGDTVVAGWNSFDGVGVKMGVGRSADGGDTWSSALLGGFDVMSDPAIAAAGAGVWYYSYIARGGIAGSDLDIFVQRSVDDGVTWLAPVAVTADANFDDKSYVAAQGNEVLVAYADFGTSPAKIHAARSIDGGVSFDHDTVLANASVGGNGACPVIAPDGTFYVFWRDSFQQFLWMSRSDDAGETWTPDAAIVAMQPLPSSVPAPAGGYRLLNLPAAAAAPNGDLVVVWNDQLLGDADILAIRSTDGGDTWSLPARVNDDPPGALQFFPWVAIDGQGDVHVVWYDRRNDDVDLDLYYASSTDGGATFGPNIRLTAASFVPVLPTEGGAAAFIGDYNGIAAGPAGVFPFYQDSRRGEQDVWVQRLASPLFRDGFESGDSSAWSATVP
ncbi:MAG: exo-alpha-sialidase [Thermoanaerobaculia bacterium]|nr:exo-alpha-sialidase [Thermoanaerobaculia bacterium]MBP9824797.1 exo-alpha-sialidase [Thermoanaerobaculia bacterium]